MEEFHESVWKHSCENVFHLRVHFRANQVFAQRQKVTLFSSTVSWLLLSEIFPAGITGRAFSIVTVLNWGTNLLVSLTFLDMLSKYTGRSLNFIPRPLTPTGKQLRDHSYKPWHYFKSFSTSGFISLQAALELRRRLFSTQWYVL